MFKFFRKIRHELVRKNLSARENMAEQAGKTRKPTWPVGRYLKYAIGEIILVVIGILIAIQVSNWNQQRVEQNTMHEYYTKL